jgi:hypothetical protein
MASLMSAMDATRMPTSEGENGHPEYEWSVGEDLQGRFVQVFFQLVRSKQNGRVFEEFGKLLREGGEGEGLLRDLCKALVIHTRDCVDGKGERDLAYGLLMEWYKVDPEFAKCAFVYWMYGDTEAKTAPPGTWKDVVNLCNYIAKDKESEKHPMIEFVLKLMATQIQEDTKKLEDKVSSLSLVGKWAPRESSKPNRKWFYRLSQRLHPFEKTDKDNTAAYSSHRKTRRMLSALNRALDTMEIKQCGKHWAEIEMTRVPSVAFQKQKRALLNLPRLQKGRGDSTARSEEEDRVQCAENVKAFMEKAKKGEVEVKAKHTTLYDMVRDAVQSGMTEEELDILEAQWRKNGEAVLPGLPPMIPMVDVSGSMTVDNCTPLYNAVGLGLRASEKTHPVFQNRILTFSEVPEWVVLDPKSSFRKRVQTLQGAKWEMTTNFYKALDLILKQMVLHSVPAEEVEGMVLAIFSDMQMNQADQMDSERRKSVMEGVKSRFAAAGYRMPHILYWNLCSTNGFPSVTTEENVTMLSGFSQVLLNALENKGMEELKTYTPFRMIREILEKPRFRIV